MPSLPPTLLAAVRDSAELPVQIASVAPTLAGHRYLLLTTTKRDGTEVGTPIWFAVDDGALVATSEADAWKVKRLRREAQATIAPCDVRGKPLGKAIPVVGEIITDELRQATAQRALTRRYGVAFRAIGLIGRLRRGGRAPQRAFLALHPA